MNDKSDRYFICLSFYNNHFLLKFIKFIYAGEIKTNDKSLIKPYELNIVLPELKLAIQFNGIYWHSSNKKDNN